MAKVAKVSFVTTRPASSPQHVAFQKSHQHTKDTKDEFDGPARTKVSEVSELHYLLSRLAVRPAA